MFPSSSSSSPRMSPPPHALLLFCFLVVQVEAWWPWSPSSEGNPPPPRHQQGVFQPVQFHLPRPEATGKESYEQLVRRKDQHPNCAQAFSELATDCDEMDDEQMAKLGVRLANCFLRTTGRATGPCEKDMSAEECTREMDESTFSIIALYTTHAKEICIYLQSTAFRQRTEQVVNAMAEGVEETVQALGSMKATTDHLVEAHQKIRESQDDLHSHVKELQSQEEVRGQKLEEHMTSLQNVSSTVKDRVTASLKGQQRILQGQGEMAEQLSKLDQQVNRSIENVQHHATLVSKGLAESQTRQKEILEGQENVRENLQDLQKHHQALEEHLSASLNKQEQLLRSQKSFAEKQEDDHKKTITSLRNLRSASSDLDDKLESSLQNEHRLIEGQQSANEALTTLRAQQEAAFEVAAQRIQTLHNRTIQINDIVSGVGDQLDKVFRLQTLLNGRVVGIGSVLFYVSTSFLAFLLTSTRRTSGARFWILLGLTINVMVEGVLPWIVAPESLDRAILTSRFFATTYGWGILLLSILRYRDWDMLNNQMLSHITRLDSEILEHVREVERLTSTPAKKYDAGNYSPDRFCLACQQNLLLPAESQEFSIREEWNEDSVDDQDYASDDNTSSHGESEEWGEGDAEEDVVLNSEDIIPAISTPSPGPSMSLRRSSRLRKSVWNPIVNMESPKQFQERIGTRRRQRSVQ